MNMVSSTQFAKFKVQHQKSQIKLNHIKSVIEASNKHEIQNQRKNMQNDNKNSLYLVVGSEKGMCGNFNSKISKFFKQNFTEKYNIDSLLPKYIIILGKKLFPLKTDFILDNYPQCIQNNMIECINFDSVNMYIFSIANYIIEKSIKNHISKLFIFLQ